MFKESRTQFGKFTKIEIENEENGMLFEVIPEKGAKLNRIVYKNEHGEFDVLDGYKTPEEVKNNYYSKSSILAPFPNRIKDGIYFFDSKKYILPINMPDENNSIHGFIENKVFSIVSTKNINGGYMMHLHFSYDGKMKGYPFLFDIDVFYIFKNKGIEIKIDIKNTGKKKMPFGLGWHPYFKTSELINNLELQLPEVEKIEVDDRLIPTGEKKMFRDFISPTKIACVNFDTCFHMLNKKGRVLLFDYKNNIKISVILENENNKYNYFQIFTPPKDSVAKNTIAIEPMTCIPDAFNNHEGLLVISPGELFTNSFLVEITPV